MRVMNNSIMKNRTKVAAYARVSEDSERLEHSLEAQISYYTALIQNNPDWQFVKVFYDDGISGTSLNRPGFIELMEACEGGLVDLILVKSISRFGRNSMDMLNTIRYLKTLGIGIFFERENINTLSVDGEILLTLLSSFAEEESCSISSNVAWAIRNGFPEGKHKITHLYGYRIENREFTIIPEEAEVVKRIFSLFLEGNSIKHVATLLNEAGLRARDGSLWKDVKIRRILDNQAYTGDILTQKMYTDNFLSHRKVPNQGVLPQYLLEDHHEPIIPKSVFNEAQELLAKRSMCRNTKIDSPFIRKIFCPYCSHFFTPAYSRSGTIRWVDGGILPGNVRCKHSTSFRDKDIRSAINSALGKTLSDQELKENIKRITVTGRSDIDISMKDGRLFHTHISRPAPRGRCANKEVNHAGKKSRTR